MIPDFVVRKAPRHQPVDSAGCELKQVCDLLFGEVVSGFDCRVAFHDVDNLSNTPFGGFCEVGLLGPRVGGAQSLIFVAQSLSWKRFSA